MSRVWVRNLINIYLVFQPNFSVKEISTVSAPVLQSFLEKYSKFPVHSAIDLGRDDTVLSLLNVDHPKVFYFSCHLHGLSVQQLLFTRCFFI